MRIEHLILDECYSSAFSSLLVTFLFLSRCSFNYASVGGGKRRGKDEPKEEKQKKEKPLSYFPKEALVYLFLLCISFVCVTHALALRKDPRKLTKIELEGAFIQAPEENKNRTCLKTCGNGMGRKKSLATALPIPRPSIRRIRETSLLIYSRTLTFFDSKGLKSGSLSYARKFLELKGMTEKTGNFFLVLNFLRKFSLVMPPLFLLPIFCA